MSAICFAGQRQVREDGVHRTPPGVQFGERQGRVLGDRPEGRGGVAADPLGADDVAGRAELSGEIVPRRRIARLRRRRPDRARR